MSNTPILLVAFNRPDVTRMTFDAIRELQPKIFFVALDAPRPDNIQDLERCSQVREIVSNIDWDCEIHYDFALRNIGCRDRIVSAINWAFLSVDRLMILEDDCVPTKTFSKFVEHMLNVHKDDHSIFSISGSCFTGNTTPNGYVTSDYSLMWGWATWRDRWSKYSLNVSDFKLILIRKFLWHPIEFFYWYAIYKKLSRGDLRSVWDYQWILTLWRNNALAIRPTVSLVENIGFGADATHTKSDNRFSKIKTVECDDRLLTSNFAPKVHQRDVRSADRRIWGMINYRSVLLMWFPRILNLRRKA